MADITKPIGTAALAERLGVHRNTAWRKLKRIREMRGDRAVTRDGPNGNYRTSIKAIFEADPHLVEMRELERDELEREIAQRFRARNAALEKANEELREKVKHMELQIDALNKALLAVYATLQNVAKCTD